MSFYNINQNREIEKGRSLGMRRFVLTTELHPDKPVLTENSLGEKELTTSILPGATSQQHNTQHVATSEPQGHWVLRLSPSAQPSKASLTTEKITFHSLISIK